jgi:2-oxoisovalerate dehydrogenase E2 component (dihydrolipoyl transacylase)
MGEHLIKMPDIGEGITEAELGEWSVKIGDTVREDDILCTVITDKAAVEIPCPVDGKVLWLGAEAGEVLAVGSGMIRLQVEGETNVEKEGAATETAPPVVETTASNEVEPPQQPVNPPPTLAPVAEAPAQATAIKKPMASPSVRRRAVEAGIDLHRVHGSGPASRIEHQDLDAFIDGSASKTNTAQGLTPNTHVEEIKVIGVRRMIAQKMQESKRHIPHFGYAEEVDVSELEALRRKLNTNRKEDQAKLTLLPFLIRAIIRALVEFPQMSSRYDDDAGIVSRFGAAHIGIATQTATGLVVPVLRHAEAMDIWTTAKEIKRIAEAARNGKASREELTGSTLTITSLGAIGGISVSPIINYPEVAIIGVNKMVKRPIWQDGGFVPRDMMNLSSAFDHRIIDGWDAACFIQHIKASLENPALLFMDN